MDVPIFIEIKAVKEDGHLTDEKRLYEDELNQNLRNALSDDGWTLPLQTQANITTINGLPSVQDGTMWYDTTTNQFVIRVGGVLRKVTTTPYP